MRPLFACFSFLVLPLFLSGCLSGLLEDDFASSSTGSSREARPQIIENSNGSATCAVHGTPIVSTTAYRIASLKPLKRDAEFARLTRKHPNYLPPEWSLTRSKLYRYPGPVQYCPTCQANIERELRTGYAQGGLPSQSGSRASLSSREDQQTGLRRPVLQQAPVAGMGSAMANF